MICNRFWTIKSVYIYRSSKTFVLFSCCRSKTGPYRGRLPFLYFGTGFQSSFYAIPANHNQARGVAETSFQAGGPKAETICESLRIPCIPSHTWLTQNSNGWVLGTSKAGFLWRKFQNGVRIEDEIGFNRTSNYPYFCFCFQ